MKAPIPKPYQSVLGITAVSAASVWPPTPFVWAAIAMTLVVAAYLYRLEKKPRRSKSRLEREKAL
ncbi:MAG: hypothetical protein OXG30_03890 [bacterium]|nr:hypothetical protein [bacterium]